MLPVFETTPEEKLLIQDFLGSSENQELVQMLKELGYVTVKDISRLVIGRLSDPRKGLGILGEQEIIRSTIDGVAGDIEFVLLHFLSKHFKKRKNNVPYHLRHFKSTLLQDHDREIDFMTNATFGKGEDLRTLRIGMQLTLIEHDPAGTMEEPIRMTRKRTGVQDRSKTLPVRGEEMNNRDVPSSYRPDMYGFFHLNGGINEIISGGENPFAQAFSRWKAQPNITTDPYQYLPEGIYKEMEVMSQTYTAILIRLLEMLRKNLPRTNRSVGFHIGEARVTYSLTEQENGTGELHFDVRDREGKYIGSVVFFLNNRILLRMQEKPRRFRLKKSPPSS